MPDPLTLTPERIAELRALVGDSEHYGYTLASVSVTDLSALLDAAEENVRLRKCIREEWDAVAADMLLTDVDALRANLAAAAEEHERLRTGKEVALEWNRLACTQRDRLGRENERLRKALDAQMANSIEWQRHAQDREAECDALRAQRDEFAARLADRADSAEPSQYALMEATIREQKELNDRLAFELDGVKAELLIARRLLRRRRRKS